MSERAPEPSSPPPAPIPKKLGRYEVAFELAAGGFGTVHLARVVGLGAYERFVALKLIHPHLAGQESFVTMFFDEARVAASINHPNVCAATDFGEVEGTLYLAMDFLVGEPLTAVQKELIRGKDAPKGWEKYAFAARIAADSAEGLHAAHESVGADGAPLGIVHRDVSPPNLFVRYDGSVQVMDFGVAKAAGKMHVTAEGMAKGHVAYFAPEQLTRRQCDRRADVWSLGVVLWELVTGKRLFARESIESTLFAIARDEAPPPSAVAPEIPAIVDIVVGKALQKDPDARYQSAREMGDALLYLLYESKIPMGAARVSEVMDRLFPGGAQKKQALLERARSVLGPARRDETPSRAIRRISSRPPSGPDATDVRIPPPASIPADISIDVQTPSDPQKTEAPPSPATKPAGWRSVLAIGLAAAAGIAIGVAAMGPSEDARTDSTDARGAGTAVDPGGPALIDDGVGSVWQSAPPPPASPTVADAGPAEADPVDPTPAADPQTSGYVNVVTRGGWADVRYGDRSYGPTPVRIRLPEGRRRITLVPGGGGPPHEVDVDVQVGEVVRVIVPLRAE